MKGVTGRRTVLILTTAIAILVVTGTMVVATHNFSDVPTGAYYHDDVEAIKNAGITGGCNAAGTKYCPNDFVKRGDMAVFLNKLGALGAGTKPVVKAATLGVKTAVNGAASQDLTNDDAYHTLVTAAFTATESCLLLMSGSLSSFTFNFTDYRRLHVDFFVDGVAVGMATEDDNDPVTSTFASISATGFKTVAAGAHTIDLKGRISTGTNILRIVEPTFYGICV